MLSEQTPEDKKGAADSDVWSEDESVDSSSSSSDTSLDLPLEVSQQENNVPKKPGKHTVKTKGELGLDDLPPIENLVISVEEDEVKEIGIVYAIIEKLVVVRSHKDERPLDIDSVLFLTPREPLGKVFDVFGPIAEPFYSVRFNQPEDISEKGVAVDAPVFCAPARPEPITRYVFLEQLHSQKGSDASWKDNNEPPDDHLDYSDDEQERQARRRRRPRTPLQSPAQRAPVSPPPVVPASSAAPPLARAPRSGSNRMEQWRPQQQQQRQQPASRPPLLSFAPDVQRPPPSYGFPARSPAPPQGTGPHPANRAPLPARHPGPNGLTGPPSYDQMCRNPNSASQLGLNALVGQPGLGCYVMQQRPANQGHVMQQSHMNQGHVNQGHVMQQSHVMQQGHVNQGLIRVSQQGYVQRPAPQGSRIPMSRPGYLQQSYGAPPPAYPVAQQQPRGLAWPPQGPVQTGANWFPGPVPPSAPLSVQIPGSSGAPSPALGPFSFQLLPRPSPVFFNQAAFYQN